MADFMYYYENSFPNIVSSTKIMCGIPPWSQPENSEKSSLPGRKIIEKKDDE